MFLLLILKDSENQEGSALITAEMSELPYWIRLHFVYANSAYQTVRSKVVFTGGEKGEVDKWAQHPSLDWLG